MFMVWRVGLCVHGYLHVYVRLWCCWFECYFNPHPPPRKLRDEEKEEEEEVELEQCVASVLLIHACCFPWHMPQANLQTHPHAHTQKKNKA